ncbi:MAG TPA: Bro-N domain-containing protein [Ktedonobacterales bacterium]
MAGQDDDSRALERLVGEQAEEQVRRVWHEGRWFFSVVDVVAVLTDSPDPGAYWRKLKQRLRDDEGASEAVTKCHTLKMRAADGKQRLTDAADTETLLRIIQSIPSPRAEPFKQWLARVGAQRLEELENPAVAADSLRLAYRKKGYTEEWIETRLRNIMTRDEVTAEWRVRGAEEGREFAILTDVLHRGTFALSVREHQQIKHLPARANLRDNMTTLELALSTLAEATSAALHQARDSSGFVELQRDAGEAGEVAGAARTDIEARTGQPVVSSQNAKHLTARAEQPPLLLAPDDDAGAGDS